MPRSVTIANLITRVRQAADLENDTHVSDAEMQTRLSEMVGEMQALVSSCGLAYFKSEATISLTTFAIPADHLATIGVAYEDSAGRRRPLTEIMEQERNNWVGATGEAQVYILNAQTIELYPVPSTGTYKHTYVPQPTDIGSSATSTTVDLVTPDGEAFVVEGMCAKVLRKSETDTQGYILARNEARERLKDWAMARSLNTPRRLVVARTYDSYDDLDGSYRVNRP